MTFLRKIDGDKLKLMSGDNFLLLLVNQVVASAKAAGRSGGALFR